MTSFHLLKSVTSHPDRVHVHTTARTAHRPVIDTSHRLTLSALHFQAMLLTLFIPLVVLSVSSVRAGSVDQQCVDACADYSVTLGYCRGSFEFNRASSLSTPHAPPHSRGLAEVKRGAANESGG